MEESPLVSIAMCTYNGAKFLTGQLDTIVNQTYKNLEVIVVDDCSTDETISILRRYAEKHLNFRIYQNDCNLGFAGNFERALGYCKGDLIALCDQDDLWHHQKIELQVSALNDNVFIYHDSAFIDEEGASIGKQLSDLMCLYRGSDPEAFLFFNCVSGHSILMKRALLDYALPLKKDCFHDWWLAYVATNIGKIDFIPECLVKYRQHRAGETNILRLSREKNKNQQSGYQNFKKNVTWLSYCSSFKANREKTLIHNTYKAYQERISKSISFRLGWILFRRRKTMLYMLKKPFWSKLNYIRKQIIGLDVRKP